MEYPYKRISEQAIIVKQTFKIRLLNPKQVLSSFTCLALWRNVTIPMKIWPPIILKPHIFILYETRTVVCIVCDISKLCMMLVLYGRVGSGMEWYGVVRWGGVVRMVW